MGMLFAALAALVLSVLNFVPSLGGESIRHALLVLIAISWVIRAFALSRQKTAVVPEAPASAPAPAPVAEPAPVEPPKPIRPEIVQTGEALVLLSLLQEKGRFLDFISEDITTFKDAQVAAASRVVHQGCAAVLRECLSLAPAHAGKEGDKISIEGSADPHSYRLLGKAAGEPPYHGVVVHRGWKTSKLSLPRSTRTIDPEGENIIAPVEVEIR